MWFLYRRSLCTRGWQFPSSLNSLGNSLAHALENLLRYSCLNRIKSFITISCHELFPSEEAFLPTLIKFKWLKFLHGEALLSIYKNDPRSTVSMSLKQSWNLWWLWHRVQEKICNSSLFFRYHNQSLLTLFILVHLQMPQHRVNFFWKRMYMMSLLVCKYSTW